MKQGRLRLPLALVTSAVAATATKTTASGNPLQKAIELLTSLQGKVVREGEVLQVQYEEFSEWCEDNARQLKQQLAEGAGSLDTLEAAISKCNADADNLQADVGALTGELSTDESDLKAASLIREKENANFAKADKELSDTIDTLGRAIAVLKKSAGAGASFLQRHGGGQVPVALAAVASALGELVQAESIFSAQDTASLDAVIQARDDAYQNGEEDYDDRQAAATADMLQEDDEDEDSKQDKGGILNLLQSMLEKANAAQAKLRDGEVSSKHNYEMLKASLLGKLQTNGAELDQKKKDLASTGEARALAEGDLETTKKAIATCKEQLAGIQEECMTRAQAFSSEVVARGEELKALATAKKMIQSVSGLQTSSSVNGTASFLQVRTQSHARFQSSVLSSASNVLQRIRHLAKKENSHALVLLASRVQAAIKIEQSGLASTGADPFRKVKSMIGDMIAKLTKEGQSEAGQKEFCDREMSRSEAAIDKKGDGIEELNTKTEDVAAKTANLKEEVARLSKELGEIAESLKETQKIREEEKGEFVVVVKDLQEGITAVQAALKVLREYYAKKDSLLQTDIEQSADSQEGGATGGGAGIASAAAEDSAASAGGAAGIIGLLEVVESDFTKSLAEVKSEEEVKKDDYAKTAHELKIVQAKKKRDQHHKSVEIKGLDKAGSEFMKDRAGLQQELEAVNEYYNKLKPQCTSAPMSYEERKKRRDAILTGLKEALDALDADDS